MGSPAASPGPPLLSPLRQSAPKNVRSQQYPYQLLLILLQFFVPRQIPKDQSHSHFRFPTVAEVEPTRRSFLTGRRVLGSRAHL